MKVNVLVDNIAGYADGTKNPEGNSCRLCSEWGLSVHVDFGGTKVLLDTGASRLFVENAAALGIDLADVDLAVLSHGHYDHAGGMAEFFGINAKAPFYLRQGAAENCYHTHKIFGPFAYHEYIGIRKGTLKKFAPRIRFVEGVAEIAPGITLVPHSTPGLESIGEMACLSVKEGGRYRYDSFEHEHSLVFDMPEGLFVMNSCSHAGADNIVKEIQAAFPERRIYALLGGFHLFRYPDDRVRAFAERLRELDVQHIYTGHCTGNRAYEILHEVLGERAQQMFTGMAIEI